MKPVIKQLKRQKSKYTGCDWSIGFVHVVLLSPGFTKSSNNKYRYT